MSRPPEVEEKAKEYKLIESEVNELFSKVMKSLYSFDHFIVTTSPSPCHYSSCKE